VNYHYMEGIDYDHEITSVGNRDFERIRQVVLKDSYTYLQTVPVLPEGVEFLKAGRLPKHMNEVVAVGNVKQVGTTVDVYFHDRNIWGNGTWHKEEMLIVGVTDIGTGLYFDDRVGITFTQTARYKAQMGEKFQSAVLYYFTEEGNTKIIHRIDGELVETETYRASSELYDYLYASRAKNYRIPESILNLNDMKLYPLRHATTEKETHLTGYIGMSEEVFDTVSLREYGNQASVYIEDYSYAERVMEKIESLGYYVISPYKISATRQSDSLAKERMSTLVLCLMAVAVTLVAQVVVLAAMFGTQMENFKQMRNIGLSCRTGKKAIWTQVLFLTIVGQGIGVGLILILQRQGIAYIKNVVKYLTPEYLLLMVLVHLAGSVLLALVVCLMLRSKVFPFLPKSYEIDLSEILDEEEGSRT